MTPFKRAVEAARTYSWNNVLDPNNPESEERLRVLTREIIKAIREPDETMNLASAKAEADQHYYKNNAWGRCVSEEFRQDWLNGARYGWQAAIDAILAEGEMKRPIKFSPRVMEALALMGQEQTALIVQQLSKPTPKSKESAK